MKEPWTEWLEQADYDMEPLYKFLLRLNEASVATRYPEDIAQLLNVYDRDSVSEDFRNASYWERIDKMVEAIYPTRAPIEAVAMTPDEWENGDSMIAKIARDGETVFTAA